jgi:fused signal recognition particle receptor
MLALIIVLIAVAVLVLISAGYVITTRRRRQVTAPSDRRPVPPTPPPQKAEPGGDAPAIEQAPAPAAPPVEAPPVQEAPAVEEAPAPTAEAPAVEAPVEEAPVEEVAVVEAPVEVPPRFRDRLGRARSLLGGYLTSVRSHGRIDNATWDELEEALILADVGTTVTAQLLDDLKSRVKQDGIDSPDALIEALKRELVTLLEGDAELHLADEGTTVWLFVGVNGVGKNTTIGKLGMRQIQAGHKVVMAAGDTFRAAAADQLEMWSERVGASIIRGNEGGDPGAVVFDAVQHSAARGADLVLADTAGRLHTKTNLMEELKKVRRVAERPPGHVTEVLLVIDATTGQNGLIQARQFAEAVGVTGVVLTKLDGTAKGGIVIAIRGELGIPIKLVGLGEGAGDLVDFDPSEFVDALVGGNGSG